MSDIAVAGNILVAMLREVDIARFFATGNKNDFSSFT